LTFSGNGAPASPSKSLVNAAEVLIVNVAACSVKMFSSPSTQPPAKIFFANVIKLRGEHFFSAIKSSLPSSIRAASEIFLKPATDGEFITKNKNASIENFCPSAATSSGTALKFVNSPSPRR